MNETLAFRQILASNFEMQITVMNRQRLVRFDLAWLRHAVHAAAAECLRYSGNGQYALARIQFLDVAVVSDRTISKVHEDFMGVAGPTDVITFEHGEIVTSGETALRCADEHGHSLEEELALYVVHGLLHLNGYDDRTALAKRKMERVQDKVWECVCERVANRQRASAGGIGDELQIRQ